MREQINSTTAKIDDKKNIWNDQSIVSLYAVRTHISTLLRSTAGNTKSIVAIRPNSSIEEQKEITIKLSFSTYRVED